MERDRKRTKEEIREAEHKERERDAENLWGPGCFECHGVFINK